MLARVISFVVATHGKEKSMDASNILGTLGAMLLSGEVKVVDCTATLGPNTPILRLPEDFAQNTPKFEIHKISEYDSEWAVFLHGTG